VDGGRASIAGGGGEGNVDGDAVGVLGSVGERAMEAERRGTSMAAVRRVTSVAARREGLVVAACFTQERNE
jgi:hypothetical protein